MADLKISELGAASALTGTEEVPGVQSGGNVKLTPAQMATYVLGAAAFAEAVDDRVGVLLAGSGLTVTYNDAGNVLTVALPAQPYDATLFYPGVPSASAIVAQIVSARALTFADDFSGSTAYAKTAATASTAFDVKKNGSSVGTITFGAAAQTATFVTAGGTVTLSSGDRLEVVAPASPDATLANVSFTLVGTR